MKLDKEGGELPVDSTINLRPRSVLGLKYVEITRGRATETFEDGDLLPADQTRYPVDLEDFYRIYDKRTRDAMRTNLKGFGDAFNQRGYALNRTIEGLPRLLRHLEPVARSLAAPNTGLGRFFKELGDAARIIRPVADRYSHSFTSGADTFEAWSRYPDRLGLAIERQSRTLEAGIKSFRVQQPFLRDFRDLNGALERATATFPRTLPRITDALRVGARVQARTPLLNRPLRGALQSLRELMEDPATGYALRGLGRLTGPILNPLIKFVGPYITVCNYFNYAWTHAGEHVSEPDLTGYSQRSLSVQAPRTINPTDPSLGSIGAATPSNGQPTSGAPMNLHVNTYTAAVDRQGNADCEAGQRGYMRRSNTYGAADMLTVVDPHIPGNSGPTFTGRARVPEGQTFSRETTMGPKIPRELDP